MFGLVRTAVRFFVIGFGLGVLLAPRSGAETRQRIREKLELIANSFLDVADLPPVDGAAASDTRPAASRRPQSRRAETGAGTQA